MDWQADRFLGPVPKRQWLIENILPLGTPTMLAAFGGIGKSMLLLKTALEVATGADNQDGGSESDAILGGGVCAHGTAVIVTAEDDREEVHRRLACLDPQDSRGLHPERLIIVPLPNSGGILTLVRGGFASPETTEEFESLHQQLRDIPDLKLIAFDPLQAFIGADVNKDPAAAQYLCTQLGRLAADTGATVLVTHHFRKQGAIQGPAQAREAVRGTTALIDGMRSIYALWPAEETHARKVCRDVGVPFGTNVVVRGAVVKANWPVDHEIHTYVRAEHGLLRDCTQRISGSPSNRAALLDKLVEAVAAAASSGHP